LLGLALNVNVICWYLHASVDGDHDNEDDAAEDVMITEQS
jgi:hypothetical protein